MAAEVVVVAAILYVAADLMLNESQMQTLTNDVDILVEKFVERFKKKITSKIVFWYTVTVLIPDILRQSRRLKEEEKEEKEEDNTKTPDPPFEEWPESEEDIPEDYEWKGSDPDPSSGKGNYHNPDTGESLHNDLNHPDGIEPHWDYKPFKGSPWWRWFKDGRMLPH